MLNTDFETAFENAVADEWERHTKTKPEVFPAWQDAIKRIRTASACADEAVSVLKEAAGMIAGSGDDDRILSVADEIGFIVKDMDRIIERMLKA